MSNESRLQATYQISNREPMPAKKIKSLDKLWAVDVFNLPKMKATLPKDVFRSLKETMDTGAELNHSVADVVASAMKDWAIKKGALYFSHVFYPLTGLTAEKHDGFIIPQSDGTSVSEFTGDLLVKGEPDGSSFPNGGIRGTFEARGYTAWDVSSPAFILNTSNGKTLCIPTVFISWTGEALDKKTPLLRSNAAMDSAARRLLTMIGEDEIAPLNSSCGAEQEYFLVDTNYANSRPDLLLAGRTLFGAAPAKGQEFDDHYFGAIPARVQVFMQDVEEKLYRLGIPAKTRHNEVAPGQFEIAPYYEAANVAADHQQMMMTILKSTAKEHGFVCLLHEKPFAGINGSGKHVNWSVGNSTQGNLLNPGKTPHDNIMFLLFCGAVIRGAHLYGPLLRAVIASAGNDHRLGANEAPPAIMSVYLGSQLEDVFAQIKKGKLKASKKGDVMDLGLPVIPTFNKDAGDRNRTSPFAFTGNRFEFRAVGSNQSVAGPLIAMNTMLADSLNWISNELEKKLKGKRTEAKLNTAILAVLKDLMNKHGNVVFGGDGYSSEWHTMAVEERGLKNIPTTADALPYYKSKEIKALFRSTGVLSATELKSRYEVYAEQYIMAISVEAKLVIKMAKTVIYPAATRYLADLVAGNTGLADVGIDVDTSVAESIAENINGMMGAVGRLSDAAAKETFASDDKHMQYCADTIRDLMNEVRSHADQLETTVADDMWPLPTYEEMLFIK